MEDQLPRLYRDLAWLWPLWGDPSEYEAWCAQIIKHINRHARREVRSLLNLGCGGGKNAFHLRKHFELVGLDLSEPMLAQARGLNPGSEFRHGDMRSFQSERQFDSVFIDDAISYMTSTQDLYAVFESAYRHLYPGGVMIVAPDETKESFLQNRTEVTEANRSDLQPGMDVLFIENYYDTDTTDDVYEGVMIYLIREIGQLRVEVDRHVLGLFPLSVWREGIAATGFEVIEEKYVENGREISTFIGVKL